MQKVKLTYYKETGERYGEGKYNSKQETESGIYYEVRDMNKKGLLPEMQNGRFDGYILIEPTNGQSHIILVSMD